MKTKQAFKLFKVKQGKLYPLYINTEKPLAMDKWLVAEEGERLENGKVKSKLGGLAFRPGYHCCNIPLADHIGKKVGNKLVQRKDTVWCLVEMMADVDFTEAVKRINPNNPRDCYLKALPINGFYAYKTNPNAKVDWFITGGIKIVKTLNFEEVKAICKSNGFEPQQMEE